MAYELEWLVPDKVMHVRIFGDHNVKEVGVLSNEMNDIFNKAIDKPIVTMVNISDVNTVPTDVYQLKGTMFDAMKNPNNEMFAVYGRGDSGGISKFVLKMLGSLLKANIQVFGNREQAIRYIVEQRPDLEAELAQPVS